MNLLTPSRASALLQILVFRQSLIDANLSHREQAHSYSRLCLRAMSIRHESVAGLLANPLCSGREGLCGRRVMNPQAADESTACRSALARDCIGSGNVVLNLLTPSRASALLQILAFRQSLIDANLSHREQAHSYSRSCLRAMSIRHESVGADLLANPLCRRRLSRDSCPAVRGTARCRRGFRPVGCSPAAPACCRCGSGSAGRRACRCRNEPR